MKEDTKDLACYLCGIERNAPLIVIEWHLEDNYDVSLEDFEKLSEDLLALIALEKEAYWSENKIRGFATRRGGQHRRWLKSEVVRTKSKSNI